MDQLFTTEALFALLTLTSLEIVLGIDNIIFLTILVDRLPAHQRRNARILGLSLAMLTRITLLLSITWVMGLTTPLFSLLGEAISARDLILIGGGLFLIAKSTHEIHQSFEEVANSNNGAEQNPDQKSLPGYFFTLILVQIALIDIIFSLDSVITAVGLAKQVWVMVTAIIIAVMIMMLASGPIGDFVSEHPTLKILALSFLILIGVSLMAEGMDFHIPKGYIYFAMAFSLVVEMLNSKLRPRH